MAKFALEGTSVSGCERKRNVPLLSILVSDQLLSCFVSQIPSPLPTVKATEARRREEKATAEAKQRTEPTYKKNHNGGGRKLAVAQGEEGEEVEEVAGLWWSNWYEVVQRERRQEVNLERRNIQPKERRRRRRRRQRKEAEHNELHRHQLGHRVSERGERCLRRNCSPTSSRRKC